MVKMGTVWDRTAEFLTDNFGTLLPICLLAYFVPLSITGNFESVSQGAGIELRLVLRLVGLAFAVLSLWGSLTIMAIVFDTEPRVAGGAGARALPRALAVLLLMFVILVVLALPLVVMLRADGFDFSSTQTPQAQAQALLLAMHWGEAVWLAAIVVIAIWLSARLAVVNPVVVAERRTFGAIRRSWDMTRGLTWPIVGVMVLFAIVSQVAALATQLVFGSIFALIAGAPSGGLSLSRVLTSVMVAAVQTGFTVIAPVFLAKLYLAIRQSGAADQP